MICKEILKQYLIDKNFFKENEDITINEIGDGNINYVFKVNSKDRSIVCKFSDDHLRANGRPLDTIRSKIEANILKIEYNLAPEYIPEIYHYDEEKHLLIMQDISEYKNLRYELMEGKKFPNFPEEISDFLAKSLLPTTDLILDSAIKKDRVKLFINKELCDISEKLVLTEPYWNYLNRNVITAGNEKFVEENIYSDAKLKTEVAKLRLNFMNNSQALIHGDLHSGSIFVNEKGTKIIDPEFAFYGPMGYDIGNVLANISFPLFYYNYEYLKEYIVKIFDLTFEKMRDVYDELVENELYKQEEFKNYYINSVKSDTIGYMGTEIIRRLIGDTHTKEVDSNKNIEVERKLILFAKNLIINREKIRKGNEIL